MDRFLAGAKCLPPELQLLVLRLAIEEATYDDEKDILYRLTLVCHKWLQECSPALNHTINIRVTKDISSLQRQGDTRRIPISKAPIRELLIDTSMVPFFWKSNHSSEELFLSLEFCLLHIHQQQLPCLTHIEFRQDKYDSDRNIVPLKLDRALPALLRPWKSITSLSITERTFRSFLELSRVITALTMLRTLKLNSVAIEIDRITNPYAGRVEVRKWLTRINHISSVLLYGPCYGMELLPLVIQATHSVTPAGSPFRLFNADDANRIITLIQPFINSDQFYTSFHTPKDQSCTDSELNYIETVAC